MFSTKLQAILLRGRRPQRSSPLWDLLQHHLDVRAQMFMDCPIHPLHPELAPYLLRAVEFAERDKGLAFRALMEEWGLRLLEKHGM